MLIKETKPVFSVRHSDYFYYVHARVGKVLSTIAMMCTLYKQDGVILIGDMGMGGYSDELIGTPEYYLSHINNGFGTEVMNMLLDFAKQYNYNKIIAKLSKIDADIKDDPLHRERQLYFFKKFGFKILPSEENPVSIELDLS